MAHEQVNAPQQTHDCMAHGQVNAPQQTHTLHFKPLVTMPRFTYFVTYPTLTPWLPLPRLKPLVTVPRFKSMFQRRARRVQDHLRPYNRAGAGDCVRNKVRKDMSGPAVVWVQVTVLEQKYAKTCLALQSCGCG